MNGWEITDEDIKNVLEAHRVSVDANAARAVLDTDAIIEGVFYYDDIDFQAASAASDIEDQLMNAGVIPKAEKKFLNPKDRE